MRRSLTPTIALNVHNHAITSPAMDDGYAGVHTPGPSRNSTSKALFIIENRDVLYFGLLM